jgi:hypothetical protein
MRVEAGARAHPDFDIVRMGTQAENDSRSPGEANVGPFIKPPQHALRS